MTCYKYSYLATVTAQICYGNDSYGKRFDSIVRGADSFLTVAVNEDDARRNALEYARDQWPQREGWHDHEASNIRLLSDSTIMVHYNFLIKRSEPRYVHEK